MEESFHSLKYKVLQLFHVLVSLKIHLSGEVLGNSEIYNKHTPFPLQ